MSKYIHKNTLDSHKSSSGKAIYLTVRRGTSESHDSITWLPISQLVIGEFNDVGWAEIYIPEWLIKKNCLQNVAFVELQEG